MHQRHLKMVFSLLLISGLSACGSGGGTLPVTNSTSNAQVSTTSSLVSRKTLATTNVQTSQYVAVDAGGGTASGNWIADTDYSTAVWSGTQTVLNSINTNGISNPAPQAVYRTQRYGAHLAYAVPNLTPGANYNVRLSFVESYFTAAGKRVFGVTVNGIQDLTNFDIYQSAGGSNIAIVRQFASSADTTGKITVKLDASTNNASIAGVEITSGAVAPTPAPSPSPSARPTAQPGFGPRIAVGPQASIACAPNSVNLSPGQNIESVVSAHASGTAYCLSPGTYAQQTITPHSGDTFIGVQGATLDGQNTSQYAFSDYSSGSAVTNVTIKNLLIKNYNSLVQTAPVFASRSTTTGWQIVNNEIASNAAMGVSAATGWNIVGNYIHDNAQGGYIIVGAGVAVTDNELAHNDPNNAFNFNVNGAGGGKAFQTTNINVSYNYSHDNVGPGLWTDTDNQGSTYTYNDLENNTRNGIMHEISWDAVIQHNYLRGNGNSSYCGSGDIYCPAIFISNSGGEPGKIVDISYNTIIASSYGGGIGLLNVSRGNGIYGTWKVQNVHVHNNAVNLASSGSTFGAVDHDGSDPAMFTSQGNSFDYDSFAGAGSNAFYWGAANIYGVFSTFSGLQGAGQEMHGSSN